MRTRGAGCATSWTTSAPYLRRRKMSDSMKMVLLVIFYILIFPLVIVVKLLKMSN